MAAPMTEAPRTQKRANLEVEVKLRCDEISRIEDAGFHLTLQTPRHFEDNWLLDLPGDPLFNQGAALRVRSVNGEGLLTFKGLVLETKSSGLKVREEIETRVEEPERLIALFERLGYHRSFRYQKYRTVYSLVVDGHSLEAVFDETPIGNFIEIEGDEPEVLRVLEATGFSPEDSIRESYPELQAARCRAKGVPLEDMVF
jgi:adenylate cyclase class 2